MYCFEGMGMVIPIEDAMTNREKFTPILSVVMVIYTTLCVLSGGLGYMAFGDATQVVFCSVAVLLCSVRFGSVRFVVRCVCGHEVIVGRWRFFFLVLASRGSSHPP